LIGCLILNCS